MKLRVAKLTLVLIVSCAVLSTILVNLYNFHINLKNHLTSPEKLDLPRESFLFVEKNIHFKICTKIKKRKRKKRKRKVECFKMSAISSASSFAIHSGDGGTYVLTAAHVCADSEESLTELIADMLIQENLVNKLKKNTVVKFLTKIKLVNTNLDSYDAVIVGIDHGVDSCIMFIPDVIIPIINPADAPPEIGEIIRNIAAPAGVFGQDMVPIFKGIYNGNIYEGDLLAARTDVYSIPVTGGSSGSPVLNQKNEFVGMIVAAHTSFQNIAYSPNIKNLYEYLSNALIKYPSCEEVLNANKRD